MTTELEAKLNALAELMAQRDVLRLDCEALKQNLIPAEIAQKLADLEAEFATKADAIDSNIGELEAAIKSAVLALGESVKGQRLHAVWVKGRITWNTKGVEGYALAHPELFAYKHEGEPSVTIRPVLRIQKGA